MSNYKDYRIVGHCAAVSFGDGLVHVSILVGDQVSKTVLNKIIFKKKEITCHPVVDVPEIRQFDLVLFIQQNVVLRKKAFQYLKTIFGH